MAPGLSRSIFIPEPPRPQNGRLRRKRSGAKIDYGWVAEHEMDVAVVGALLLSVARLDAASASSTQEVRFGMEAAARASGARRASASSGR